MGKPTGFMEFERRDRTHVPVAERVSHYNEFVVPLGDEELSRQGARCMDCGIPYCHDGCPVNNIVPDWNDLVYRGDWKRAADVLHSTNNFPEFTGRVCPAPCEAACTLNLFDAPVTIKSIECAIVDRAWEEDWIRPVIARRRTGRKVAVVGSGPAGMACAQQLARAGHAVTLYEKNARIGGLLRYGIPDFKMEKHLIDRRMAQMQAEGVEFRPNSHIGVNISARELMRRYDALALCCGSEKPRDLDVEGRDLEGIHFAMDFLTQQNRRNANEPFNEAPLKATGKHVIVIGGGDTGSDCIGTANRQGASSVTQLEIMPKPPQRENKSLSWPNWPMKLRNSTSHEEGCERDWTVVTTRFSGGDGGVDTIHAARVEWVEGDDGGMDMRTVEGSDFTIKADLVLLAMGFEHPIHEGPVRALEIETDERGNVKATVEDYATGNAKVFAAGDMRRGQSLIVWAIREGRQCARSIDEYLMGRSELPR